MQVFFCIVILFISKEILYPLDTVYAMNSRETGAGNNTLFYNRSQNKPWFEMFIIVSNGIS